MGETTAGHPAWEELQAYGQGRLAPELAVTLEAHLADCARCCALLERAPGDSFVSRVRQAGSAAEPGSETADLTVTDPPDIPRELIDHPRYRVLGLIGQGGMGAVYRAEHRRMQRLVALKIVNPSLLQNPAAVERFHQEVRAAAQLHHPNIVTAYDADQAGGLHFLVMEFIPGTNLAELVRRRGPLPVEEACEYARQVALGLQHAHERGMVHRDVKPHNLMVTAGDGTQPEIVKILDFGLARLPRTAEAVSTGDSPTGRLTGVGVVMGTADYIAPEQAADSRNADIRADLYSLGCTLFFLLTGRPPFPDGSLREKLARHSNTPLPSLTLLRPDAPPALAAVISRLTAKHPARRYATPAAATEALTPLCAAGRQRPRLARKRFLAVIAGAAFAVALLAGTIVLRLVFYPASPEPSRAETPETGPGSDSGTQDLGSPGSAGGDTRSVPEPAVGAQATEVEEKASQAIQRLGGQITRDDQKSERPVVSVTLTRTRVTDADLQVLAAFPQLRTLDLGQTEIGDAGLKHLVGLSRLTTLTLTHTRVTDAGMESLARLKHLFSLDLMYTGIGDAGVQHLAGLTELYSLHLHHTKVTDGGMPAVGQLEHLGYLTLDGTAITDVGLENIRGLTGLTKLTLMSVKGVSNEGMKVVGRLKGLHSLSISGTGVTDQGLEALSGLKRLDTLQMGRLKITDAGLRAVAALTTLQTLELPYTAVTDEGLKEVARLSRLTHLNLQSLRNVTDTGVKELAGLEHLTYLSLSATLLSDPGLEALTGLPELNFLAIADTDVSDAGVRALARCQRLTTLIVGKNKRVTNAAVKELQTALPNLKIQR